MKHDIAHYVKTRHTAKAYDETKKISAEDVAKLKEILRYSASSVNSQPWHFVLVSSEEGKEKLIEANNGMYPFNTPAIKTSSHSVIFCSKLDMEDEYLKRLLEQEEKDGRFLDNPDFKKGMDDARKFFINIHKYDYKDVQHWMDKQVYLNVGQFLLAAAAMGIDATPMEGIDVKSIDEKFGLREKGYTSLIVVTLGYSDKANDFNAKLPKSRLPYDDILSEV